MQIKTSMRHYLTPVRMAVINKSTNNKCWWGCGERGTLAHCWQEWSLVPPLRKQYGVSSKIKNGTPLWPFDLLLGRYPKYPKTPIQKCMCNPLFIAVLFTIAMIWKQPKRRPVEDWIKKLWYIFTMEYYAAVKKKKLLHYATAWVNLEKTMLTELSQSVKRKIPHDLAYIWNLMNTLNQQTK